MTKPIEEKQMNDLIEDLCEARIDDAAAIKEADKLVDGVRAPYTQEKVNEFCEAGDKMLVAHKRKLAAWKHVREAVGAPINPGAANSKTIPK
jgi:hypothetical protein